MEFSRVSNRQFRIYRVHFPTFQRSARASFINRRPISVAEAFHRFPEIVRQVSRVAMEG